jgi:hypothetical protein
VAAGAAALRHRASAQSTLYPHTKCKLTLCVFAFLPRAHPNVYERTLYSWRTLAEEFSANCCEQQTAWRNVHSTHFYIYICTHHANTYHYSLSRSSGTEAFVRCDAIFGVTFPRTKVSFIYKCGWRRVLKEYI